MSTIQWKKTKLLTSEIWNRRGLHADRTKGKMENWEKWMVISFRVNSVGPIVSQRRKSGEEQCSSWRSGKGRAVHTARRFINHDPSLRSTWFSLNHQEKKVKKNRRTIARGKSVSFILFRTTIKYLRRYLTLSSQVAIRFQSIWLFNSSVHLSRLLAQSN